MSDFNKVKKIVLYQFMIERYGFIEDKEKSSRNSKTLISRANQQFIVKMKENGDWVYFVRGDSSHNGSIIDFVAIQENLMQSGKIQYKEVLAFILGSNHVQNMHVYTKIPKVNNKTLDSTRIEYITNRINTMRACSQSVYLASRHIDDALKLDIWKGRVLKTGKDTIIFPHVHPKGFCGFEIYNGFKFKKGFSKDSVKTFARSNKPDDFQRIVFCESGIDGLAYSLIHPNNTDLIISTGGRIDDIHFKPVFKAFLEGLGMLPTIVLAFDNDEGGFKLETQIKGLLPNGLHVESQMPAISGEDWGDVIKKNCG